MDAEVFCPTNLRKHKLGLILIYINRAKYLSICRTQGVTMEQAKDRSSGRFFQISPLYGFNGWFFKVRGSNQPKGPFLNRGNVEDEARKFATERKVGGDTGGRV